MDVLAQTASVGCGSSVSFSAPGTSNIVQLNVTDSNQNTMIGKLSGTTTLSGSHNTALGYNSASAYTSTESSNISIGNGTTGTASESNVLRIGNGTGTSAGNLSKAYICGIDGVNVGSVATVVTEASNQLGTAVLTAGSGITITPTANTITISSSSASNSSIIGNAFPGSLTNTSNKVWTTIYLTSSSTTQANNESIIPVAGTIDKLYVYAGTNASTSSVTVTINKNGSNTAIVATITALTTGSFSDLTHSQLFAAGDTIQFEIEKSTVGTIANTAITCRFTPS